ncbi:hypothetical protein UFOVP784_240 [uncultured Caudovirales phage]|jgi:hypothetical protein|uniref:Uncharacterized protein n=1 Tax=uncultured Caudovirales phage TaxID=2100421 RepID=A0A6J5MJL1_9CAUD|nr:hypothetical protein UFOVP436_240 [uncultured Caudovirales phage]CAB4163024.1 hypothetical protein UFOVP784_240 [uncultured Caudovirales phage]
MYSDFLSDNDDDLFESKPQTGSKPKSGSAPLTDSIFKDVENLLSIEKESKSMVFKSKLANTLYETCNNYIFEVNSYNRSIFDALNIVTQGSFQYQLYADVLEESIARRLVMREFIGSLHRAADTNILEFLSKRMNISIDSQFFTTYIVSMQEMMDHAIDYNIGIYIKVCEKIGRTPLSVILDKDTSQTDMIVSQSGSYINKSFAYIRHELGMDVY